MRSGLFHFIQAGIALTASAATQLMAQTTPVTPRDRSPSAVVQKQDAEAAQKAALLKDKAFYGNSSVFDILTKPEFALVKQHLGFVSNDIEAIVNGMNQNPLRKKVRLRDCVTAEGAFDDIACTAATDKLVRRAVGGLTTQGASLDDAMRRDPLIKEYIGDKTRTAIGISMDGSDPSLQIVARNTRLNEIFGPDGSPLRDTAPAKARIQTRIADAIWGRPLADLVKREMFDILHYLEQEAREQSRVKNSPGLTLQELDAFFDLTSPAWRVVIDGPGSKLKIGDILENAKPRRLRLDKSKIGATASAIKKDVLAYGKNHALRESAAGVSVYDYLHNTRDPTGAVERVVFPADPLVNFLAKSAAVPGPVNDQLKHVRLADVLSNKGDFKTAVLRDAVIQPIKDKVVSETNFDFLAALGTQIATVVTGFMYHPDNETFFQALTGTKMGAFISGGDPWVFERLQREFGKIYPLEERALDVTRYRGDNGAKNPWRLNTPPNAPVRTPAAAGPPAGTGGFSNSDMRRSFTGENAGGADKSALPPITTVPFSFDIKDNTLVAGSDSNIKDIHALNEDQKSYFRYVAWRLSLGPCARFTEVTGQLPPERDKDGLMTPRGIAVYGADLRNVPINGNPDERGPYGVSLNVLNPLAAWRADIAIGDTPPATKTTAKKKPPAGKSPYAKDLPFELHEGLHTFYGQAHPFTPMGLKLPGTIDETNQHSVPGLTSDSFIDTDTVGTSYNAGTFRWITPTRVDIRVGQRAFGACPADYTGNTITLRQGTEDDVVKNRNPLIAWTSTTQKFGQTIPNRPGATFDFTNVDGKPGGLSVFLDLNETSHTLLLNGTGGTRYKMTRVDTFEPVENARLTNGNIVAAPGNGVISVENGGTLNAGKPGDQTLIGGIFITNFIGGPGRKTFQMRASPKSSGFIDTIDDCKPGDRIVVPAGTSHTQHDPVYDIEHSAGNFTLVMVFFDAPSHIIKTLLVAGAIKSPRDITIETPEGKPVAVVTDTVLPPTTQPAAPVQGTRQPSQPARAPVYH